ncbi:serine acetyltransferase [Paraburkholderia fungorum]|uniref:serine O-acetyltransferase n=1 Tax=Paraburkholderia fungorum TaxID=134537 RepID=UPI0038BCB25F
MNLKNVLTADLNRLRGLQGMPMVEASWWVLVCACGSVRFLPVAFFRFSHAAHSRGRGKLAHLFSLLNFILFGLEASPQIEIGPGLFFPHTRGTVIGARSIGANATIFHQVTIGASQLDMDFNPHLRPALGDEVTLGAGAKILGAIEIGSRVIIGANSVVVKDVPSDTVCAGVPAKVVRQRNASIEK